ncbi:MAG: DUF3991 and toprim domain-containing protein [Lachnospiraceae bacterium]|jgi:hypothetical protein|nr:DUF3991 and toprim domain-containing protein [Lachnospiraceae bacterium]
MKTDSRVMPFTEEQMRQVYSTSIIDLAVENGFEIEKGDRQTVHVKNSGGLYLFKHGRGFNCFTTEKHGDIVDFAMEYLGQGSKTEAIALILGCEAYGKTAISGSDFAGTNYAGTDPRGEMELPPRAPSQQQAFNYLVQTRGLDDEIVAELIGQGKIFQSKEIKADKNGVMRTYQNCCFVGFDDQGRARYCSMRAMGAKATFKQDRLYSDKTYGFTMAGRSRRVYEFEAAIDAISHASLCALYGIDWRKDHRVAEGCLSDKALRRYLQGHPEIREIVFCYDNDVDGRLPDGTTHNHGQERAAKAMREFGALGYVVYVQTPRGKDFNCDLRAVWEEVAREGVTEGMER